MESAEPTPGERPAAEGEKAGTSDGTRAANKPLHRFLKRDPRSFGIAVLIIGCAELLMGFQLAHDTEKSSYSLYVPFWQGALFITSGILSILADIRPSKKLVTSCLAMYVVSILGCVVSIIFRLYFFSVSPLMWPYVHRMTDVWRSYRRLQILSIEAVLFVCSSFVFGLLIFLSTTARFALKSTNTQLQVIVKCVPRQPESDVTAE